MRPRRPHYYFKPFWLAFAICPILISGRILSGQKAWVQHPSRQDGTQWNALAQPQPVLPPLASAASSLPAVANRNISNSSSALSLRVSAAPNSYLYVALGDSYSAGNGASPLFGVSCRQAPWAAWSEYLGHWLKETRSMPSSGKWINVACSGYTTADMLSSRQLDWLSDDTKWVTITAGGNDITFAGTITACVGIDSQDCFAAVAKARGIINELAGRLSPLYNNIAKRAPNAHIFVAGYPDIVPFTTFWECVKEGDLTREELADMRSLVQPLNQQIAAAATSAGSRFTFVDVEAAFKGHEPCSPWPFVNALKIEDIEASYHPNRDGQYAYASRVWYNMVTHPSFHTVFNTSEPAALRTGFTGFTA